MNQLKSFFSSTGKKTDSKLSEMPQKSEPSPPPPPSKEQKEKRQSRIMESPDSLKQKRQSRMVESSELADIQDLKEKRQSRIMESPEALKQKRQSRMVESSELADIQDLKEKRQSRMIESPPDMHISKALPDIQPEPLFQNAADLNQKMNRDSPVIPNRNSFIIQKNDLLDDYYEEDLNERSSSLQNTNPLMNTLEMYENMDEEHFEPTKTDQVKSNYRKSKFVAPSDELQVEDDSFTDSLMSVLSEWDRRSSNSSTSMAKPLEQSDDKPAYAIQSEIIKGGILKKGAGTKNRVCFSGMDLVIPHKPIVSSDDDMYFGEANQDSYPLTMAENQEVSKKTDTQNESKTIDPKKRDTGVTSQKTELDKLANFIKNQATPSSPRKDEMNQKRASFVPRVPSPLKNPSLKPEVSPTEPFQLDNSLVKSTEKELPPVRSQKTMSVIATQLESSKRKVKRRHIMIQARPVQYASVGTQCEYELEAQLKDKIEEQANLIQNLMKQLKEKDDMLQNVEEKLSSQQQRFESLSSQAYTKLQELVTANKALEEELSQYQ